MRYSKIKISNVNIRRVVCFLMQIRIYFFSIFRGTRELLIFLFPNTIVKVKNVKILSWIQTRAK